MEGNKLINASSTPGLGSSDPQIRLKGSPGRAAENQRIQATTGVPNGNPVELEP